MLTLQKSFDASAPGEDGISEIIIEAVFPQFGFRFSNGNIERFVKSHNKFSISHNIDNKEYHLQLPLSKVTGKDNQTIYGFFLYHFIEILNTYNINDFSFPFTIYLKSATGQNLASEQFEALMLKKNYSSFKNYSKIYDDEKNDFESTFGPLDNLNNEGLRTLPNESNQLCYLISAHP